MADLPLALPEERAPANGTQRLHALCESKRGNELVAADVLAVFFEADYALLGPNRVVGAFAAGS